jgi:hypothetical protein
VLDEAEQTLGKRLARMVPGEQMSAKMRCSSSQTVVVPFGERLGIPSAQTVGGEAELLLEHEPLHVVGEHRRRRRAVTSARSVQAGIRRRSRLAWTYAARFRRDSHSASRASSFFAKKRATSLASAPPSSGLAGNEVDHSPSLPKVEVSGGGRR